MTVKRFALAYACCNSTTRSISIPCDTVLQFRFFSAHVHQMYQYDSYFQIYKKTAWRATKALWMRRNKSTNLLGGSINAEK